MTDQSDYIENVGVITTLAGFSVGAIEDREQNMAGHLLRLRAAEGPAIAFALTREQLEALALELHMAASQ